MKVVCIPMLALAIVVSGLACSSESGHAHIDDQVDNRIQAGRALAREARKDDDRGREEIFSQLARNGDVHTRLGFLEALTREDEWGVSFVATSIQKGDETSIRAASILWREFPSAAARVTDEILNSMPSATAKILALEAARAGHSSPPIATILGFSCDHLPLGSWGLLFLDGPPKQLRDYGSPNTTLMTSLRQVAYVCPRLPAAGSQLRAGDLIVGVDGEIDDGTFTVERLRDGPSHALEVERAGQRIRIELTRAGP